MTTTPKKNPLEENSSVAKDFFEQGKKRAGERFENADVDGVVNRCWGLIDNLYHDKSTGKQFMDYTVNELSGKAGELSILKAYVGQHASWANLQCNNSYIFKKFQRANKRKISSEKLNGLYIAMKKNSSDMIREKAIKPTVGDIEAELEKACIREEQDWAFNQGYADRIINLFKSIDWILTSIGWRMKELQSEQMSTHFTPHSTEEDEQTLFSR